MSRPSWHLRTRIDVYKRQVIFIIKKAIEEDFKIHIGNRISKYMDVAYVYQELDKIPDGYQVPEGRVKPWGTGHAVLCCSALIDGPFAVINADEMCIRDRLYRGPFPSLFFP